jgi:hypothetical protein
MPQTALSFADLTAQSRIARLMFAKFSKHY